MGNPLISFRLAPEMVAAIGQRYPDRSPSEGAKALIIEALGMVASPDKQPTGLDEIYQRLERLEASVFSPDDTVSTPVDTLLTPDDIKGIILGILKDSEINSLAKILAVLKARGIKIPSPRGAAKPTNQNIKPFLPEWWVKG